MIEIAENVCNLKKEEADWMLKIDIVEQGDKLEVRTVQSLMRMLGVPRSAVYARFGFRYQQYTCGHRNSTGTKLGRWTRLSVVVPEKSS